MPFKRRSRGVRRSGRTVPSRKVWGSFSTREETSGGPFPGVLDNNEFQTSWLFSPVDAQEFYDEPTLLRTLFRFTAYAQIPTGFNNALTWSQEVRCGIILARAPEATPDEPELLNLNDATLDWIWYQIFHQYHIGGDVISIITIPAVSGPLQGVVDLRTKRKIPEGYGLAFMIQNMDQTLAPTDSLISVAYSLHGRFLLADH